MALDLQALSITSAFNAIISFFRSQENNSKWKDLTTGAEGLFLIRMLANVITNISYKMITARRENYITTANLLSSNLGIAVNLGYSANRGNNQKRRVQFVPNGNYTIPKLSVIGTYNDDYDIISLTDLTFVKDQSITFDVVIGKTASLTFTTGTEAVKIFSQFAEGISQDFVLYVDGNEVPTSAIVKDLVNDKYLVRTNPYASVDIMYLNSNTAGLYRYGSESEIELKYVVLANVPTIQFTSTMFSYGTVSNVVSISQFVPFETVDSIKINAPIDHEVQNLIRSKEDYSARVKEVIPNVIETSYYPVTPTYTLISYLKDDYTLVTANEITSLNSVLETENFFGTPLPDITVPRRDLTPLYIYLKLTNKYMETSDIKTDINNILANNYAVALAQTFNTYNLERLLEGLSYVKYARVNYQYTNWTASSTLQLGSMIQNNNTYYKAGKILGVAGVNEPAWNVPVTSEVIDTGLETTDNSLIWRCYKRLNVEDITQWSSSARFKIGDYTYSTAFPNYMFKCVDIIKYSDATTPDVSTTSVGDFIVDGGIVWVCITYNSSYSTRVNNTAYRLGSLVNISGKSFESVSYVGSTGKVAPNFEQPYYTISSATSTYFVTSGNQAQYFLNGDIIKVYGTDGIQYTFTVKNSTYNLATNSTNVYTVQTIDTNNTYNTINIDFKGTIDNEIFWEIVEDITDVTYDWNVYNVFDYTVGVG